MAAPDHFYSIDTSALIHGWRRAYPPANFGQVWTRLEELIAEGRLRASIEVINEIERKDDELCAWCNEQDDFIVDIDDAVQNVLAEIMGTFPKLVDTAKGKSGADPFVIALAQSQDPRWTIVSQELGGTDDRPKIPYVCAQNKLRCINLLDLIQEREWKF